MTKRLVRISPKTGEVLGWIDFVRVARPEGRGRNRRVEWDCLRRQGRPAVRDGEVVAEALRNQDCVGPDLVGPRDERAIGGCAN